jgi:hypothetical protein
MLAASFEKVLAILCRMAAGAARENRRRPLFAVVFAVAPASRQLGIV